MCERERNRGASDYYMCRKCNEEPFVEGTRTHARQVDLYRGRHSRERQRVQQPGGEHIETNSSFSADSDSVDFLFIVVVFCVTDSQSDTVVAERQSIKGDI